MDIDPSLQALTPTQLADLRYNLDRIESSRKRPESHIAGARRVTLKEFSDSVGCHFTTASRLRSGERLPGRTLFNKIVQVYGLDPADSLRYFCGSREGFGQYLRDNVFHVDDMDMARDKQLAAIRHKTDE